jgi:poly(3-hydroxybutyrate) depolymerase
MRPVGMMRRPTPVLAGLCALWMLDGCGSDGDGRGGAVVCTPNASLSCACPNGRTSTASCLPNGSGLGPCACSEVVDSGRGADAATAPDSAAWDSSAPSASDGGREDAADDPEGGTDGSVPSPADPVPSAGCGVASPPPSGSMTIDVSGVDRKFVVKLPSSYDASRPYRLVLAWHGLGGAAMQVSSSFFGLAERSMDSAIFIAGQGLPGTGAQSGLASWSNRNDRDISFTRQLLEWAKENYCIDTKRVFSIGMSNGAMMSNIVGCELGASIRAIAAMSGGGPRGYAMNPCTGQVAAWIAHGNRDTNVPFSYGQMSRDYWRNANNCGTASVPATPGSCLEYQDCDPGFPVQFCEFDGGHTLPSFTAEAAWKFFEQF